MAKVDVDVIIFNSHGVGQVCEVQRLPRRGETMDARNWRVEEDGGKGCSVAVAIGRLGCKAGYLGKVGFDPWGDMGEKWMNDAGIDTTYMYRDANVATGTGLIMVDADGLNTIVDGDSACRALTEQEIHEAIDAMSSAKYFITGFGMPFEKALIGAQYAKEKYGMQVFCNVSPVPHEGLGETPYIDYYVINDIEAKVLLGLDEHSEVDAEKLLKDIQAKHKVHGIIMTCGGDGSYILDGEDFWYVEPIEVKAVDTICAGDGYLAALVHRLNQGDTLRQATEWASKYAAYKVTRKGSMTRRPGEGYPSLSEVEDFISKL